MKIKSLLSLLHYESYSKPQTIINAPEIFQLVEVWITWKRIFAVTKSHPKITVYKRNLLNIQTITSPGKVNYRDVDIRLPTALNFVTLYPEKLIY